MPLLTPGVNRKIFSLDAAEGAGPEAILLHVLRWLAEDLAEPLAKLFANYLTTAVVHTDWRFAIICSMHKKMAPRKCLNAAPYIALPLYGGSLKGFWKRPFSSLLVIHERFRRVNELGTQIYWY